MLTLDIQLVTNYYSNDLLANLLKTTIGSLLHISTTTGDSPKTERNLNHQVEFSLLYIYLFQYCDLSINRLMNLRS